AYDLCLDVLVEVHDERELSAAVAIGSRIIGVNNRNLSTFDVSLDVSKRLGRLAPSDTILIAESGLTHRDELLELQELGYSGFLIGETLMRSGDPQTTLENWV
ncbi:MAG: indole-3-glycerol-phosphate synthase TrpC, partial [Acidobacteria bacterium]|nr:indole-3-glycerol-phosphate synthase TrpC [Acidobacteriota bacterium]